jgi:hypothetical protein
MLRTTQIARRAAAVSPVRAARVTEEQVVVPAVVPVAPTGAAPAVVIATQGMEAVAAVPVVDCHVSK